MKTILVPVDFSTSSNNAAAYATALANDMGFNEIILAVNLHVPLFEQIIPSPDLIQVSATDIQSRRQLLSQRLDALRLELLKVLDPDIIVRVLISELPFLRSVLEQVLQNDPGLVIIGSTDNDMQEDSIIGRQIIELTRVIPVPVLIVPSTSSYQPVATALVAGEFKSFDDIAPLQHLDKISQRHHASLLLLNLSSTRNNLPPAEPAPEIREALNNVLKGHEHAFYNLNATAILPGIIRFAEDKQVQLIIALPGRHSFLYNLTHQNLLQGLSLNSEKPLLVLK
ncbi:MAG TPA: universal stress protein [Puia sp.]|nr:universal stress protein [Puia sp.]